MTLCTALRLHVRRTVRWPDPANCPVASAEATTAFIDTGWDFVGESDNGTENIWAICEGWIILN